MLELLDQMTVLMMSSQTRIMLELDQMTVLMMSSQTKIMLELLDQMTSITFKMQVWVVC